MARNDDSVRFQITMSKTMTDKVEKLADELGISRSAAVNVLVSQGLQAQESVTTLKSLLEAIEEEKAQKQATGE